jgi:hypothetical protein
MGKYRSSATRRQKPVDSGPHAIWRGLGCIMMIIIPIISFALAYELVNYGLNNNWSIPYQLLGTPQLPEFIRKSDALWSVFGRITVIKNFYAYATLGILIMVLLSGSISVIYAIIYRILGPSRWGPMDMPPPKFKTKKYTR